MTSRKSWIRFLAWPSLELIINNNNKLSILFLTILVHNLSTASINRLYARGFGRDWLPLHQYNQAIQRSDTILCNNPKWLLFLFQISTIIFSAASALIQQTITILLKKKTSLQNIITSRFVISHLCFTYSETHNIKKFHT